MSLFDNVQRFQTLGITTETINNGKFQREIYEAMRRFKSLDWGDVSETDTKSNNEAVKTFSMVLGAYNTSNGKIWIIAESSTGNEYDRLTVLFPDEY